jgi:glycosyltransferase involved in cell wall biosynthesis
MNVGIVLTGRNSKDGGGYTITKDLFDALIKRKNDLFTFYFIIRNEQNQYFSKELKKNKIDFRLVYDSKFKIFLLSSFPFLLKIFNYFNFNKYNEYFKKNSVNLVWFLSSENMHPLNIPYITTIWDIQHKTNPRYKETGSFLVGLFRHKVISVLLNNSKKIIVGTKVGYSELNKHYLINKKKIFFIPHPTPSIFFKKFKKRKKIYNLKKYFLYPANFWEHKNHLRLIEAFSIFNSFHDSYQLVLTGDCKDRQYFAKIKNLIKTKGLNKRIKILRFVTIAQLIVLYDGCECLIYPSTSGPENLPPLEAFARGKQVLISNYPGAREQLIDNAHYFNPYNHLDIYKIMDKFVKKKILYKKDLKLFSRTRTASLYLNKVFYLIKSYIQ